ncbi:MAG: hypothetical protein F4X95_01900 [Oligoflexia bacterium]|nr:hypothetical protein [Oligoflexia bacterium]
MFEKLRKPARAKNIVSYFIFGFICLVFVFIGVPVDQMSNMGGAALIVNNQVISWSEYRNYLELIEQQSQESFGADLGTERQERLKRQAMDSLLNMELINQEIDHLGLVSSDQAVQDKVVELPLFQEEGRFKHSKYRAFLSARRFSAAYFENLIRKEIQIAYFQNMFNMAVRVSKAEKEKEQQLKSFTIKVSYISFSYNDIKPEEFNNINRIVQSEDADLLSQIIKDKKWQWEQAPSFDLSHVFLPGLESQKILFDKILNYLPETGLIKNIIGWRDQSFILKVDAFQLRDKTKKDIIPLSDDFFVNKLLAQMTFLSWVSSARSSAKLKFSPRLQIDIPK